ncbi:MAG: hypothetical protein ACFB9M_19650 [Myxococcota bacterium]
MSFILHVALTTAWLGSAHAQHRNHRLGFEVGYVRLDQTGVKPNAPHFGARIIHKLVEHWWISSRFGIALPGSPAGSGMPRLVRFQIVPLDIRYYLATDAVRPFVGAGSVIGLEASGFSEVHWGPGALAGFELRVGRGVSWGVQTDWNYIVTRPRGFWFSTVAQVNFGF